MTLFRQSATQAVFFAAQLRIKTYSLLQVSPYVEWKKYQYGNSPDVLTNRQQINKDLYWARRRAHTANIQELVELFCADLNKSNSLESCINQWADTGLFVMLSDQPDAGNMILVVEIEDIDSAELRILQALEFAKIRFSGKVAWVLFIGDSWDEKLWQKYAASFKMGVTVQTCIQPYTHLLNEIDRADHCFTDVLALFWSAFYPTWVSSLSQNPTKQLLTTFSFKPSNSYSSLERKFYTLIQYRIHKDFSGEKIVLIELSLPVRHCYTDAAENRGSLTIDTYHHLQSILSNISEGNVNVAGRLEKDRMGEKFLLQAKFPYYMSSIRIALAMLRFVEETESICDTWIIKT